MRKLLACLVALVWFHCASASAHAQLFGLFAPFENSGPTNPRTQTPRVMGQAKPLTFTPINTGNAISPPNYANSLGTGNSRLSLPNFLRPLSFNTSTNQGPASSNIPAPSTFQSTRYPNSFQPVAPIIPKQ